ncbi:MAG: NAD(P)-dependent dehydrogenase (short-subunit alcohol dehydrogenase family) [Candidatus Poriferisodalaceae bacterium]|jgi:NAD(P)-dependent dehydrogenase (short-subunit alcohol dehydrogenase family)
MGRMDGKIAVVVVGGASGFGLATSQRFADEGATVVVWGRRGGLAAEIGESLGGACDISDFDQVESATAATLEQFGRIDAAVNYAGFERSTPIRDLTPDTWQPMIDVQFTGAVWFIRAMANAMAETGGGSIISTSSLTAQNPTVGQSAYAGSKKGLEYVTQIAAIEYGADNVRVNCVSAHLVETPMTAHIFRIPLVIEAIKMQTPLGRMGHVDDIANAVLFLASDEAGYISGQTLCVDGAASTQKLPSAADYGMLAGARPELLK